MKWITANCGTRINLELATSCTPKYFVESVKITESGVSDKLTNEWLRSVRGSQDESMLEEQMRKETGKSQRDLWWPGKPIQAYAVRITSRLYFFDEDPTLEDNI